MFSLLKTGSHLLKIKSLELNHHYITLVHSSSKYFDFDCSILKMILKDLRSLFSLIFLPCPSKTPFSYSFRNFGGVFFTDFFFHMLPNSCQTYSVLLPSYICRM